MVTRDPKGQIASAGKLPFSKRKPCIRNTEYCSSVMLGFCFSFGSMDESGISFTLQWIWCWWKVPAWLPWELSPVEALSREAKDPGYRLFFSSGFNDGRGNRVYTKPSPAPRNILLCLCSELSLRLLLFGRAIQTFLHLTDFTSIPSSHQEIWLLAPACDVPLFSLSRSALSIWKIPV